MPEINFNRPTDVNTDRFEEFKKIKECLSSKISNLSDFRKACVDCKLNIITKTGPRTYDAKTVAGYRYSLTTWLNGNGGVVVNFN